MISVYFDCILEKDSVLCGTVFFDISISPTFRHFDTNNYILENTMVNKKKYCNQYNDIYYLFYYLTI